jgi:hypothetical protein
LHGKVDEAIVKQKEILVKYEKSLHIYPYWEKELVDLEYTKLHLDEFIDNLAFHRSECKKWKMLFSISSYYEAQITFGDGKMEFFIHSDDLKKGNFDNIYCHIYN